MSATATETTRSPAAARDTHLESSGERPLEQAVEAATRSVPPLWPLDAFVAVNPFLGLSDRTFADAAQRLGLVAGARITPPRALHLAAVDAGKIRVEDLARALADTPRPDGFEPEPEAFLALARRAPSGPSSKPLPSVADAVVAPTGRDWPRATISAISSWASGYFDRGQALWPSPFRHLPPYAAWRQEARLDRSPELLGLGDFRRRSGELPEDADGVFELAHRLLGLPDESLELYLHRLLMTVSGWAGYARYQGWQSALHGRDDNTLRELLAVRLAWDCLLLQCLEPRGSHRAWRKARAVYERRDTDVASEVDAQAWVDVVLQTAGEYAFQRSCCQKLAAAPKATQGPRPHLQAAFCIDVRSEVLRRALEDVSPGCETLGFAGFFGFPIEYRGLGQAEGDAHCPALLKPKFVVQEGSPLEGLASKRARRLGESSAWASFKKSAIASFGFVESTGLAYLPRLVRDGLGLGRPVELPSRAGLRREEHASLAPSLEQAIDHGSRLGLSHDERVATAEGVLRAMSLTRGFARLVVLAGHGSSSTNNPHAASLDCGACGGHSGEANARVAAAVLNDPQVRGGLRERGIEIPHDTVFVACLHDTTTDEVRVCDPASLPDSHQEDIAQLRAWLTEAGARTRQERSTSLGLAPGSDVDVAARERASDWSQVRPEWGLAGCAAFVVAPRARTRHANLEGRSFLHDYDWRADEGFSVLELIMTAPMVVTSWISLQYYASAVDNRTFGSGNKTLHNVTGGLGVLEGAEGDLRTGLPLQCVHDGTQLRHEPLRLSVFIEAPLEAMTAILRKHPAVRELADHGWLHLVALDEHGRATHRYAGELCWTPMPDAMEGAGA